MEGKSDSKIQDEVLDAEGVGAKGPARCSAPANYSDEPKEMLALQETPLQETPGPPKLQRFKERGPARCLSEIGTEHPSTTGTSKNEDLPGHFLRWAQSILRLMGTSKNEDLPGVCLRLAQSIPRLTRVV